MPKRPAPTSPTSARLTRACLRNQIKSVLLSEDLLTALLVHLSIPELKNAACVCTSWREAAFLTLRQNRRSRGLYAVGGCYGGPHPSSSLSLATVQRYDPFRGEWNALADLTVARDHLGLATTGGQVQRLPSRPNLHRVMAPAFVHASASLNRPGAPHPRAPRAA